jgi:spermidine/putrescine transport system permease protein
MIAALVLTLVPSLGMFVVSDLLSGAKFSLIGNLIAQQFTGAASNWPLGSMLGLTLVGLSLAGLLAMFRWGNGLGGAR